MEKKDIYYYPNLYKNFLQKKDNLKRRVWETLHPRTTTDTKGKIIVSAVGISRVWKHTPQQ